MSMKNCNDIIRNQTGDLAVCSTVPQATAPSRAPISKECNLEIVTKKKKVFGFVGTDHLRTIAIINDETLEQVNQFTYLGCSVSYQFSNDAKSKLAKFLHLIGTIKRTIFRKVRRENILKICNTLILPTFLYGSENWTEPHRDEELKRQK